VAKFDKLMPLTDLVMLDIKHIDDEHHFELTKQHNAGILAFAEYLSEKGVDTWIRHVVVPGITDDDEYLYKLGYFIGGLKTLRALDVLPYHDMGKVKYEKLGIDYPLKDTPPMDKTILLDKKKAIINGIKARRAELGES
jgi:pyruvate formate lyase activating enzyme